MIKVVAISDTHTYHDQLTLPIGDILLHAGDFTFRGKEKEVRDFGKWFSSIKGFKYKILVAGNHDQSFEGATNAQALEWLYNGPINDSFTYLQDRAIILNIDNRQVKVYGSPWQPYFFNWAFNLQRGNDLKQIWKQIPDDTTILITHGPPYGILDECQDGAIVGCQDLEERIQELKQLKLHVFGHIHEAYGIEQRNGIYFANACSCTAEYKIKNLPIIVEI